MNIGDSEDKTGVIHKICVNNEEIKTVEKLELLGVILDTKASQRTGVLMRLRNLIPTSAKLVLFKTAILPYLTYCQLVWHFCRASDSRKIERLQERGLRAVYNDHYATYSEGSTTDIKEQTPERCMHPYVQSQAQIMSSLY